MERFGHRKVPGLALWPVTRPRVTEQWPENYEGERGDAILRLLDRAMAHLAERRGAWLFDRPGFPTELALGFPSSAQISLLHVPPDTLVLRVEDFNSAHRVVLQYVPGASFSQRLKQKLSGEIFHWLNAMGEEILTSSLKLSCAFVPPTVVGASFRLGGLDFRPRMKPTDFIASLRRGVERSKRGAAGEGAKNIGPPPILTQLDATLLSFLPSPEDLSARRKDAKDARWLEKKTYRRSERRDAGNASRNEK
jgi:hypothetical protein